jgi:simple sugar transport system permease protein
VRVADLISSLPGSAPKPKRVLDALIRYGLLLVTGRLIW